MDTQENPTARRCKKLYELPPVVTEWQQATWRPDCAYYDRGTCANSAASDADEPCPFDGMQLPLRELALDADNPPRRFLDARSTTVAPRNQIQHAALAQTIKRQVMQRTAGRIQMLDVEVSGDRIVIRGWVSCYHLKQLALQGVLDALGSPPRTKVELNVHVAGPLVSGVRSL
jgi:hypothetical protein